MVVHGAIDGYPRLIVFLNCATDNTAATVINAFHTAVRKYGLHLIFAVTREERTHEHPLRGPGS